MTLLLAAAPLLAAVVLILALGQSAVRAGLAGLGVALAVAWWAPAYRLDAGALGAALGYGALTTLLVAYVLIGGLVLYQVLQRSGALTAIAGAIAAAVPDPGRRLLVLVLGLSVFFESATGFGIGIIVTAPLLLALGFTPRRAALIALMGQCAVPWGALGIGTTLGAELTGYTAERLGVLAAPMGLPQVLISGAVALWLGGGRAMLLRRAAELVVYGVALVAALALASHLVGIELAGCLAGLAVTGLGLAVGRRRGRSSGDTILNSSTASTAQAVAADAAELSIVSPKLSLFRAVLPLALLLAALLATRLLAPLAAWLTGHAVLRVAALDFTMPVLYHPGFWMLAAAFASAPLLGLGRADFAAMAVPVARQWTVATLAVAGFLCFSQVMYAAGMTTALAGALAAAVGQLYTPVIPLIGGLGGFLTASNAGSNAMFARFQASIADQLSLPGDVVAAAQNAAGANATLASPGRVVLAAAVTGLAGREATLMRPALAAATAGLAAMSLLLWVWL